MVGPSVYKVTCKECSRKIRNKGDRLRYESHKKLPVDHACDGCKFLAVCRTEVWRVTFVLPCFVESPRHPLWLAENHKDASYRSAAT
jgi:hypothetical protein